MTDESNPRFNMILESVAKGCALILALLIGLCIINGICGCKTSGVRVVASSRSIMSVGDINWDEYKIPIFSLYSGPHLTVWVNKDFLCLKRASAMGSVTNDVSALGIYSSKEDKASAIEMEFQLVPKTNLVTEIEAVAK